MAKFTIYILSIFIMLWIPSQSSDDCLIDLVFVLDESGSVCDGDVSGVSDDGSPCSFWGYVRDYMLNLTKSVPMGPEDVRLAVVTFALEARVHWELGSYSNLTELQNAISTLPYEGGRTNTYDGLTKARGIFDAARVNATKVAVVITDGEPSISLEKTQPEAQYLKDAGVLMFAIGVGPDVPQNVLEYLSTNPRANETYFTVPSYPHLGQIDFMDFLGDCEPIESSRESESEEDDDDDTTPSSGSTVPGSGPGGSGDNIGKGSHVQSSTTVVLLSSIVGSLLHFMSRTPAS